MRQSSKVLFAFQSKPISHNKKLSAKSEKEIMRIFTTFLILMLSFEAFACKCKAQTEAQRFSNSVEVLYVQVLTTEYVESNKIENSTVKVTYKILEAMKSSSGSVKYVVEGLSNCAPNLQAGRNYLLYIDSDRWVSRCTGSSQIAEWTDWGKKRLSEARIEKAHLTKP